MLTPWVQLLFNVSACRLSQNQDLGTPSRYLADSQLECLVTTVVYYYYYYYYHCLIIIIIMIFIFVIIIIIMFMLCLFYIAGAHHNKKLESWLKEAGKDRWPEMVTVAELINRILKRQPIPSDPHVPLPTPSASAWTAIQTVAEQVADITAFVDSCEPNGRAKAVIKGTTAASVSADHVQYDYIRLRKELVWLPYNLLAGHLPNLDLDVGPLMR